MYREKSAINLQVCVPVFCACLSFPALFCISLDFIVVFFVDDVFPTVQTSASWAVMVVKGIGFT